MKELMNTLYRSPGLFVYSVWGMLKGQMHSRNFLFVQAFGLDSAKEAVEIYEIGGFAFLYRNIVQCGYKDETSRSRSGVCSYRRGGLPPPNFMPGNCTQLLAM
jgi:hypothetical protein